jgi:hypothetical protein
MTQINMEFFRHRFTQINTVFYFVSSVNSVFSVAKPLME